MINLRKRIACIVVILLCIFAVYSIFALVFGWTENQVYYALGFQTGRCDGADGCFAFYQVGNGDCSVVYTDTAIGLIDTGTTGYARSTAQKLNELVDEELDFVVISHPHDDHAGGYAYLLDQFKIKRLYIRDYNEQQLEDYAYYQNLLALSKESGVEVVFVKDGMGVRHCDISLAFYQPSFYTTNENDRSLITLVSIGKKRCLYMGDSGALTESVIVKHGYALSADILKIGHHGSNTATSSEFLQAVSPDYGVICVGYNLYGHPSHEVTDRLNQSNIPFFRTDVHNVISFMIEDSTINTVFE